MRHGASQWIGVKIERHPHSLLVQIEDRGCGFDYAQVMQSGKQGLGIRNMEQLVASISGTCNITSQQGEGTCITIQIPLEPMQAIS